MLALLISDAQFLVLHYQLLDRPLTGSVKSHLAPTPPVLRPVQFAATELNWTELNWTGLDWQLAAVPSTFKTSVDGSKKVQWTVDGVQYLKAMRGPRGTEERICLWPTRGGVWRGSCTPSPEKKKFSFEAVCLYCTF